VARSLRGACRAAAPDGGLPRRGGCRRGRADPRRRGQDRSARARDGVGADTRAHRDRLRGGPARPGLLRKVRFPEQHELRPGYDVVIVGGGVNGLSLAYHLAEVHGIGDVAVLERSYLGSGASGRNTQVLRANYNTPETVPLYEASLRLYRT